LLQRQWMPVVNPAELKHRRMFSVSLLALVRCRLMLSGVLRCASFNALATPWTLWLVRDALRLALEASCVVWDLKFRRQRRR